MNDLTELDIYEIRFQYMCPLINDPNRDRYCVHFDEEYAEVKRKLAELKGE